MKQYGVSPDIFSEKTDFLYKQTKQSNPVKFFLECINNAKTAGHMIQYTIKDLDEYRLFGLNIIDLHFNEYVGKCQKVIELCNEISQSNDSFHFGTYFRNADISLILRNDQTERINISLETYTAVCYFDHNTKRAYVRFAPSGKYTHNIIMYENLQPYASPNRKGMYPMNIKDIFRMFIDNRIDGSRQFDVLKVWLDCVSERSFIYKDIIRDYLNGSAVMPPMSLEALNNIHNKTEFIQSKIKKAKCTSRDNKVPLAQSYYIHKALPYIKNTDFIQKLYDLPIDAVCDDMGYNEARRPKDVIRNYYKYVCRNCRQDGFITIINDYMTMAEQLGEKFDLSFNSFNQIRRKHDAMAKQIRNMDVPEFTVPDTVLSKLCLPEQYVRIENKEDLIEESIRQEHCVASYAESIKRGQCLIYTTVYNGSRYTFEIRMSNNKYVLIQFRGKFNSDVPAELEQEVQDCLSKQNKKIRKKK